MLVKCLEQIQLGILLNLHAQVVKLLDWRIAGQEIQRPWTEADDFELA